MAQTWDAKAYGEHGAFVHGLAGGVLEWLAVRAGEEILDIGCGDGQLTLRLVEAGARVRGVDASPAMVAAARGRGLVVDEAKAEALPFADASFDAVFSNAALHWVREQDAMMAEVRRVLRPGGRFVAEMGGQGNIAAIRVALAAVLERYGVGNLEDGVNYYPTPQVYTRRLAAHGLRVDNIALIPRPTPLGEGGMEAWLRTFRRGELETAPEALRETIVRETVELLRPILCDEEGHWGADYMRLRFAATAV